MNDDSRPRRFSRSLLVRADGAAAVEFGLVTAFVLIALLVGVVDVSRVFYFKLELSQAVAAGVRYALLNSSDTSLTANIQTVVQNPFSGGTLPTVTQAFYGPTTSSPSACYCLTSTVNGTPVAQSPASCSTTCAGDGTVAGGYLKITATYTFTPLFPNRYLIPGSLSETAIVRLQ